MSCGPRAVNAVRPEDGCGVCGAADEESSEGEAESGARKIVKAPDPKKPSAEAVAEHDITHLPYRNWCPHCVRGRGKEIPHRRTDEKPNMFEVHMDFAFLGEENEPGGTLPMLVVKERSTKRVCPLLCRGRQIASSLQKGGWPS